MFDLYPNLKVLEKWFNSVNFFFYICIKYLLVYISFAEIIFSKIISQGMSFIVSCEKILFYFILQKWVNISFSLKM